MKDCANCKDSKKCEEAEINEKMVKAIEVKIIYKDGTEEIIDRSIVVTFEEEGYHTLFNKVSENEIRMATLTLIEKGGLI